MHMKKITLSSFYFYIFVLPQSFLHMFNCWQTTLVQSFPNWVCSVQLQTRMLARQLEEDIIIVAMKVSRRCDKAEDRLTVCTAVCLAGGTNCQPQRLPSDSSHKEKTREIKPVIGTQC